MASLFSNLNNTQKSEYGGLFGASSTAPGTSTPGTAPSFPPQSSTLSGPGGTGTGSFFGGNNGGGGNLFGSGLGQTTTATSAPASTGLGTSSLFGGMGLGTSTASTAAPATSSLFGNTGTTAAKPAGGLFSGFGGASTQQQPSTSGNTFGQTAAPTQNQNYLSTTSQPQQQKPKTNSAYFNTLLNQSQKRTHVDFEAGHIPQLQLGLDDLRRGFKKLNKGADLGADGGRAHYLLAASGVDPGAAVRDLKAFTNAAANAQPASTQPGPESTDVETYLQNLQTQTTLSMIADGLSRSVKDFDAFLEENVVMEWDAQRKRIYDHFGIRPKEIAPNARKGSFASPAKESQQGGFGRSRRSKAGAVAGGSTFGKSSMNRSVIGSAGPLGAGHSPGFSDVEKKMEANNVVVAGPHDRLQRDKQSKYAEKVQGLNQARLAQPKRAYPICKEFAAVVKAAMDTHGPDLVKAYRTLVEIVGEDPEVQSLGDPKYPKERGCAKAHLEEKDTPARRSLKKAVIRGGARCLEKLAFEGMETVVANNPREANLGGIPNVINKVKAYVRLQAARKNLSGDNADLQMLGDDYVWALLYSLLRTGHIAEANQYVRDNQSAFRSIDRSFQNYINAYATNEDRRLDVDLQQRINNEYNQRARIAPENSIDPYRMACYKIIGRCDLRQHHLELKNQNIEDFAWVQLVLAREIDRVDTMASEVYSLEQAQNTMREIGNRYFTKGGAEIGSSFGAFVFLQMAVGMFEDAVSYLYSYNYVDGVHLAIALDFYGLLRVSDPTAGSDELYSLTSKEQPQISFGPMLALYTRDFRAANVAAAVDYLTLMCLNQDLGAGLGERQRALCHEALRELVLESREFAELLGDMQATGVRIPGLIEQRMQLIGLDEAGDFYRAITMQAASQADDNGRVTDAVLLYHLAGEYNNVILTLSRTVSEAVNTPLGQAHDKLTPLKPAKSVAGHGGSLSMTSIDDPIELARGMLSIYEKENMFNGKVKMNNLEALRCLLDMQGAKYLVENGAWSQCLDAIATLDILPLRAASSAPLIRSYANKFSSLPPTISHNVPNLILWAILSSKNQRILLENSGYGGNEGTRLQMREQMRGIVLDLMTFMSQLRYRFPPGLCEEIARAQGE